MEVRRDQSGAVALPYAVERSREHGRRERSREEDPVPVVGRKDR